MGQGKSTRSWYPGVFLEIIPNETPVFKSVIEVGGRVENAEFKHSCKMLVEVTALKEM